MLRYFLVFSFAFFLCVGLTPLVMWLAGALGAIDHPGARRLHSTPTPRLGGLAVFASVALAVGLSLLLGGSLRSEGQSMLVLLMAAAAVMLLGFVDDCTPISPSVKLVAEIAIAVATYMGGYRITSVMGWNLGLAAGPLTVLWIVALTNAFNLIDGLDGLASGIGAIISATLFALCAYESQTSFAVVLAGLCGSLFGFLRYNFFPARIFLGDSGSLFLGFLFALVSIRMTDKSSAAVAISVPFLVLGLPLGEMVLTIMRRMLRVVHVIRGGPEGKRYEFFFLGRAAVFTADKAHIHHRLLDLGLNHRSAVLLLYSICSLFCAGALTLTLRRAGEEGLILGTFAVVAIFGVRYLGYKELRPLRNGLLLPLLEASIFRLRPFQVLLDIASIAVAYLLSHMLWLGTVSTPQLTFTALQVMFLVSLTQVAAFAASGLYYRAHRLSGIGDLLVLLRALAAAAAVGWGAALVVGGMQRSSLPIAVLDTYILGTLVISWRFSFAILEHCVQIDGIFSAPGSAIVFKSDEVARHRDEPTVRQPFERVVKEVSVRRGNGL